MCLSFWLILIIRALSYSKSKYESKLQIANLGMFVALFRLMGSDEDAINRALSSLRALSDDLAIIKIFIPFSPSLDLNCNYVSPKT